MQNLVSISWYLGLIIDVTVRNQRNRLELVNYQLQLQRQHGVNNMLMIQALGLQRRRINQRPARRQRTVWIRPWLERRVIL